jgi:hypothetical protein
LKEFYGNNAGGQMRKKDFIGKNIDIDYIKKSDVSYHETGKYDDHPTVEIFLHDYELVSHTDKAGYNAYSILLHLSKNLITNIDRIGHCHMCHGQGSDDLLLRFPHNSLEDEAQIIMERIISR